MSRSIRNLALSAALLAVSCAPAFAGVSGGCPRPPMGQAMMASILALFGF